MYTLLSIADLLVVPLESQWTKFGKSIEERDPLGVIFHIVLLFLYILLLTIVVCGLAVLAYKFWAYLLIPTVLVCLICFYANKRPQTPPALYLKLRKILVKSVLVRKRPTPP